MSAEKVDKTIEISLLADFYGDLLTPRQRELLMLYYEENYTLAEIAEELSITRQAVHLSIQKTEAILHDYEAKLGVVRRYQAISELAEHALDALDALQSHLDSDVYGNDVIAAARFDEIRKNLLQMKE